jgi:hypothetical protein
MIRAEIKVCVFELLRKFRFRPLEEVCEFEVYGEFDPINFCFEFFVW